VAELCAHDACECRTILLRTYTELRATGCGDERAFRAAMHVLALRHPGQNRDYYAGLAAQWIAGDAPI
jgi:hypothetical protein